MLFYVLFLKATEFAFLCPSLHVGPARGDERLLARRLLLAVGRLSMLRKRKQHRMHAMSMREAVRRDETGSNRSPMAGGLGRALTNRFQLVTCWPSVLVIVSRPVRRSSHHRSFHSFCVRRNRAPVSDWDSLGLPRGERPVFVTG